MRLILYMVLVLKFPFHKLNPITGRSGRTMRTRPEGSVHSTTRRWVSTGTQPPSPSWRYRSSISFSETTVPPLQQDMNSAGDLARPLGL